MKNILLVFLLILATAACFGKKGWSQADRDKLVNTCADTALKNPSLDKTKVTNYCSCYQQNLEKNHPNINDLATMTADEMTKSAQECLPMMFK